MLKTTKFRAELVCSARILYIYKQNIVIMAKSKFYEEIKTAVIERQVEDVYNKGISLYFGGEITYPFACDGFVDTKTDNGKMLKLIIEYKFDEEMNNKVARAKVLSQVVAYLKRFENDGLVLPNVCMVGDINECFVLHTNDLLKYLDEDADWSVAPSNMHKANPNLVMKIANDDAINPFIFNIDENFSFKNVADRIKDLADNVQRYVRVTEHNIATIFDYFCRNAVKDAKKIQANELVAIFMGVITDKENYYPHPMKKNVLVTPNGEVAINGNGFTAFFSYFDRTYTPQEKNKFAEISDRLIEDTKRRNTGEFYTPTLFVDYAHRMLEEKFGLDWKEKYVVWDNCCGTKNLTRDYRFNELYCSTLESAELAISERYNKEGTAFQFDFLNDSLDKLPMGLRKALEENKPIILFINPPYATASNMGTGEDSKGKGTTATMVSKEMVAKKLGNASNNLYAQFLYRIAEIKKQYNLTDCHIGLFSPTLFLTGGKYIEFRKIYLNEFSFDNAVQFKASHFADVADSWGISFSIWTNGETADKHNFNYTLIDNIDGEIVKVGDKVVYNIDGETTAKDWQKELIKGIKVVEKPTMSSALVVKEGKNSNTKIAENAIGCYLNVANDVDHNAQFIAIYSSADSSNANGISILPQNFGRIMCNFASRRLVACNWVNSADQYLAPNTENDDYKEFENDSIIYSLFESKSNQSSLRNIDYKSRKWDIKNEFFFMSKDEIETLANENGNDECYADAHTSTDRYVYNLLNGIKLSAEAQAVLDKARELTIKSFPYRSLFNEEHPEYQVNNWDCGWYQIKAICKEYLSEDLKEFGELYKKLADKMRPMVYELGFLK